MQIIKINLNKPNKKTLEKASKILKNGGIVVCPTDTAYLLAADATNEKAIEKVFKIKGRLEEKPIHVVVSDISMAKKYVYFNELALKLARQFLPGPLTIVLRKVEKSLPSNLTSGKQSLGIRIPSLTVNILFARKLGNPYTATSANKSGEPNPYSLDEVINKLPPKEIDKIDLCLDAGKLKHVKPSTVISCIKQPLKILRTGPITKRTIEKVLNVNVEY